MSKHPQTYTEVFSKFLQCTLSDSERMKRGIEIGNIQEKIRTATEEFEILKRNHAAEIKKLKASVEALGQVTRTGTEERAVDCIRTFDYGVMRVTEHRTDTGVKIDDRLMDYTERQPRFYFIEPLDMPPAVSDKPATEGTTVEEEKPAEPTKEDVEQAISHIDAEWKFKEEIKAFEKIEEVDSALAALEGEADSPMVAMKRRVLRDEINTRKGMAPSEFGNYKDLAGIEVIEKEGDGWYVAIKTLNTWAGWIRSYTFNSQQTDHQGGEALTAMRVFDLQSQAIIDAAWYLKQANRKDNKWSGDRKRVAAQICKYADELIAAHSVAPVDDNTEPAGDDNAASASAD
jgi:hypothetical protein